MGTCLSEQDLESYVTGEATPGQIKAWMSHIATCETCAALNHPNIAAIYGFEEVDDTRFLVLDVPSRRNPGRNGP